MTDTTDAARIAKQRALGMTDQVIAARLATEEHAQPQIEGSQTTEPEPQHPAAKEPSAARSFDALARPRNVFAPWLASSVIAIALVAIALVSYMLMRPPVVYSISLEQGSATSTPISYGMMPALADPDFYARVLSRFIANKATFIDADLQSMKLTVYKDGSPALEVPILAKGKPGSWWETPVGIYKIETKEKNHFSSFGEVNMPWSLDFDGNFFIHGWPSYPDGTPVSSSYSGGCIRLSTEDALKVFSLSEVGMPVLVYKTKDTRDPYQYSVQGPKVPALSYLVADISNGTVLLQKNSTSTMPIASITKLITALVVIEHFNLDHTIMIQPEMITQTTKPRLKTGQEVSVHDLLIVMLTESSNEAAESFARALGREQFVALMNQKARSIGLAHTSFTDPAGLDPTDVSTPEDLFTLLKYIYENRRFVFDISRNALERDAYGEVVFKNLENFNFIPGATNPFIGGKIGNTDEAGETYSGVFLFKGAAEERPIAVIALDSPDVQKDIAALLKATNATYGSR